MRIKGVNLCQINLSEPTASTVTPVASFKTFFSVLDRGAPQYLAASRSGFPDVTAGPAVGKGIPFSVDIQEVRSWETCDSATTGKNSKARISVARFGDPIQVSITR